MMQPNSSPKPRPDRLAVRFDATLMIDKEIVECRILNISAGGAQIIANRKFSEGDSISLSIKRFGTYQCKVVWQNNDKLGVQFAEDKHYMAELVMAMATYG